MIEFVNMNREWYDTLLLAIFIVFAAYKGARLQKTTRLGWSFASYNFVLAVVFTISAFLFPNVGWDQRLESVLMTCGRLSLVASIVWCVVEVELSRRRSNARDGTGQQT